MASSMTRRHTRNICNLVTGAHRAAAEIHVLEPNWKKLLVKTAQLLPNVLSNHQKSARRLVDEAWLIKFTIEITIAAIHRVRRPQPVYSEHLKYERRGRWETPDRETRLR